MVRVACEPRDLQVLLSCSRLTAFADADADADCLIQIAEKSGRRRKDRQRITETGLRLPAIGKDTKRSKTREIAECALPKSFPSKTAAVS
jgi:hypothetical protein